MKIPRSKCFTRFVVALAAVAALSPLSGIAQAPTATRPLTVSAAADADASTADAESNVATAATSQREASRADATNVEPASPGSLPLIIRGSSRRSACSRTHLVDPEL